MTIEFTEENFSIVVDDQNPAVEIIYQGVNAQAIAVLDQRVDQLEIDMVDALAGVQAGTSGSIGALTTTVNALSTTVATLGDDLDAETAARIAADATIVADRIAADAALAADIAAEPIARAAADAAEVVARDAAIASATAPIIANHTALAATVTGLSGDVGVISAAQAALATTVTTLDADVTALDAAFTALSADFVDTNNAVLAESAARASSEAAIIASIPTTENIQDMVAALLVAGTNVTLTYNDPAGTVTIDVTGGSGDMATDLIWDAKGDLAVGTGANTAARLPVGTDGQILAADSAEATGLKWIAAPTGGSGDVATDAIWDAKGDLAVGTGANTASRLPVGTDGYMLAADSAEATGLKWVAATAGPEGPTGPAGPTGPTGPAGATGASARYVEYFCDFVENEFYATSNSNSWKYGIAGTGGLSVNAVSDGHQGVVGLSTGTGTTGIARIAIAAGTVTAGDRLPFMVPSAVNGKLCFECYYKPNFGPANGAAYAVIALMDDAASFDYTMAYFSSSGMSLKTAVAGVETTVAASASPTANNWHKIRIEATRTSVTLYLNDVAVATSTTNLPTGALTIHSYVYNGGSSTTNHSFEIDWFRVWQESSDRRITTDTSRAAIGPDSYPVSPNSMDDEFEGTSLDSKWSNANIGSVTKTFEHGCVTLDAPSEATLNFRGIEQTLPAGNWRFEAKMSNISGLNNTTLSGIALRENSTGKMLNAYRAFSGSAPKTSISYWTSYTAFSSSLYDTNLAQYGLPFAGWSYWAIEYDGTNYYFDISYDGVKWLRLATAAKVSYFTADRIMLIVANGNSSVTSANVIDWFRRVS